MRLTVEQIMQQIASTVNQESDAPDEGSTEWSLWLQYTNRAYEEWIHAHDWEALRKTTFPAVVGVSVASVALPLDFMKLAAPVKNHVSTYGPDNNVPIILDEEEGLYEPTDRYIKIVGDTSSGFNIVFNPGTLSSGASIEVQYFSVPTSLASGFERPLVQDSQFLVDRTIAYIFEARSDPRFQIQETKARERLLKMVEDTNAAKYNSFSNQHQLTTPERRSGFRLGRD